MKKLLLLVAAATMMLSATAENLKIQTKKTVESSLNLPCKEFTEASVAGPMRAKAAVTPEGTVKPYMESGYFYSLFGLSYSGGLAVDLSFSEDGSKVFFSDMFQAGIEGWIQGNISTDGTSVVVPSDIAIAEYATYNVAGEDTIYQLYPVEILADEEGNITGVTDLVLKKDGDKIFIEEPDPEALSRFIGLVGYEASGDLALFTYMMGLTYEPVGDLEVVELPEGAVPADFIYSSTDLNESKYNELGKVYVQGNDVYMNKLAGGAEAWVKGTLEGNTVTFKAHQFLGVVDGVYMFFDPFYIDGTTDEDGYLLTFPCDYSLTYDAATNTYSNDDPNIFGAACDAGGSIYYYRSAFVVKPYAGDKPAVPSDPYNLYIEDYLDYFDQYFLGYTLDNVDVDGNFLNPANLYYYIYMDGEIYTLTPEVFVEQTEPELTLLPYDYSDGYDVGRGYAYIGETLFTTLGIQAVYICDGVTNYSNVVSVDLEGNVYTDPAPQGVDGLNNVPVKQITSMGIYDAEGRKLDAPKQGVNIVKMVAADGSVKVVKMFKK
jgi:hypothetical protein